MSTLVIRLFQSRPRRKLAKHTRRVCQFVNRHVCCERTAFISVCKTFNDAKAKLNSLLVCSGINIIRAHPQVETYWGNS